MLEGLDTIPWHTFRHCLGDAYDLPGILRKYAAWAEAPDPTIGLTLEELDEWWDDYDSTPGFELHNALCHQGGFTDPVPLVIPFLIEIIASPTTNKADVLGTMYNFVDAALNRVNNRPGKERIDEHTRYLARRTLEEARLGLPTISALAADLGSPVTREAGNLVSLIMVQGNTA